MKCPLCGFDFDAETAVCRPACPLQAACIFVCCPRCGYQAVDVSRATSVKLWEAMRKAYVNRYPGKTRV